MGLADVLDRVRENKRGIKDNSFFSFNFSCMYAQPDPSSRKAIFML